MTIYCFTEVYLHNILFYRGLPSQYTVLKRFNLTLYCFTEVYHDNILFYRGLP